MCLVQLCGRNDHTVITKSLPSGFPGRSAGKESTYSAGTWVQSLGWEEPLEKEKATPSSILAWRIPWTGELQFWTVHGVAEESDMT